MAFSAARSMTMHAMLHTTTQAEHQVQSRLFLNVVVRQSAAVFQLLAGKNQPLLIRWDSLLVLNLRLDVVDCIAGFHIKSDSLASEGLHENLHTSSQAQHQVQSRLFLNVVVRQSAA